MITKEQIDLLKKPFSADAIKVKMQTQPKEGETGKALCVAYIDARDVMDRLDEVIGGDWQDFYSIGINGGVECRLTICGITRSDVGTADDNEKEKSAYSDAFKRAAVKFGIGRFLYDLPKMYGECSKNGKYWNLNKGELEKMQRQIQAHLNGNKPAPNGNGNGHTPPQPAAPNGNGHKPAEQPAPADASNIPDIERQGIVTPQLLVELSLSENVAAAGNLLTRSKLAGKSAAYALPFIRKYRSFRDAGESTEEALLHVFGKRE